MDLRKLCKTGAIVCLVWNGLEVIFLVAISVSKGDAGFVAPLISVLIYGGIVSWLGVWKNQEEWDRIGKVRKFFIGVLTLLPLFSIGILIFLVLFFIGIYQPPRTFHRVKEGKYMEFGPGGQVIETTQNIITGQPGVRIRDKNLTDYF